MTLCFFSTLALMSTWSVFARLHNVDATPFSQENALQKLESNFGFLRDLSSCAISADLNSNDKFLAFGKQRDVELLHLRIVFLNESKAPSFGDNISFVYDPSGWVWSLNEQGKAILSLPYDNKVLSCTTLSRETRHMTFPITSHPPDCVGKQTPELQLEYVVNLLAKTAQGLSEFQNSSICHRFVENGVGNSKIIYQSKSATGFPKIRYKCCSVSNPRHDIKISPNKALSFILTMLWLVSCIAAFFTPLLIKYLPNGNIQNGDNTASDQVSDPIEMYDCSYDNNGDSQTEEPCTSVEPEILPERKLRENDYITLSSSTPLEHILNLDHCLSKCPGLCPRLARFFMFIFLIPLVFIAALITYSYVLRHEVSLQRHAGIKTDFIQMCLNPDPFLIARVACYILSCILLCIPSNLASMVDESVLLVGSLQGEQSCCIICTALQHEPDKSLMGHELLCDNMLRHLKFPFSLRFWKVLFSLSALPARWLLYFFVHGRGIPSAQPWKMNETEAYCVGSISCWEVISIFLWLLASPFWFTAFFCIACFILFLMIPIGYFFSCVCFVPLVFLVQRFGNNVFTWFTFFVSFSMNALSALFLIEVITFSWAFILKLFGFTIMGLIVGVDYYIPYIVYVMAVIFYAQNFWRGLNDKYLKLKVLLFDECMKHQSVLLEKQGNSQAEQLVIKHHKTELPMIPKELYRIVCRENMPFRKTVASALFNLLVILLFLSFAFASIMAFGKWAKLPSLTEASATAFLSTLPKLLRYQGKHTGKSMLKEKKLQYFLEVHVSQFARKMEIQ